MGFGSDGNRLTIVKFFHNQLINSNRLKLVDYYCNRLSIIIDYLNRFVNNFTKFLTITRPP